MPDSRRVLVIDDDHALRVALRERLEMLELEVMEAADAASAVNLAETFTPDLVVTDVNMPGFGSGLDVVRMLRADSRLRAVPIIILTGTERSRLGKTAELGKITVFQKPPDWHALMEAVSSALASARKT